MKKWIAFLLILTLSFVLYGCPAEDDPDLEVSVRSVAIEDSVANMEVGEEVQLKSVVTPSNAPQTVVWSSSDEEVATVSETGLVKAVGAGTVDITLTSTVNNRATVFIAILVTAPIVYEDPTSVVIEGISKEFSINSIITLVAKVYPLADQTAGTTGANQLVLWESDNEEIATVNNDGRVTGVAIGTAKIKAIVVADQSLSATFDVTVTERKTGEIITDPEEVRVTGETKVEEGYQIALIASVLPSGVSQNVTWTSETPEFASVSNIGIVTAIKAGTAYIKVASNVDLSIYRLYEIEVMPAVPEPTPTNMNNYEIIIMTAPHVPHEHDPHLIDYAGLDKQAKIDAWAEAEDKFNAKLTVDVFPTIAPWGPERIAWINENAEGNTAQTDIFVSTTDWVVNFATHGSTVDVLEFYETYGKNSMEPGVKAASSYKGALYALPTSSVGSIKPYHGLFYNKLLLERLGLENPAKMFNEGRWTWENFRQYVEDATAVLGEEESVLSGKPAGLYYGMTSAAGLSLIDPNAMSINFSHGYANQAANLIRDLYIYSDKVWGDNAWDAQNPSFNTGKSVFQVAEYWFVKDSGRFDENMWGVGDTQFGYVPFPYPDSISKDETRVAYQGGAIYQMSTGRIYPTGITAEDVYRVWTDMMLGTTRKMNADPEMNEDVLMRRAAGFKLDDEESIEAIAFFKGDKVIWDPYFSIVPSWSGAGPMIDAIVVNGDDYTFVIDSYDSIYRKALDDTFG